MNTQGLTLTELPNTMYEELRAIDEEVGREFGYICDEIVPGKERVVSNLKWKDGGIRKRDNDDKINAWIDDPIDCLPYYSFTMNGAHRVLYEVLSQWPHKAKLEFFWQLQKEGSPGGEIAYPDFFSSLASTLPQSICRAFINALPALKRTYIEPPRQIPQTKGYEGWLTNDTADTRTCAPWVHAERLAIQNQPKPYPVEVAEKGCQGLKPQTWFDKLVRSLGFEPRQTAVQQDERGK